jgi:hypothetical protein
VISFQEQCVRDALRHTGLSVVVRERLTAGSVAKWFTQRRSDA